MILRTKRLLLREVSEDDVQAIMPISRMRVTCGLPATTRSLRTRRELWRG